MAMGHAIRVQKLGLFSKFIVYSIVPVLLFAYTFLIDIKQGESSVLTCGCHGGGYLISGTRVCTLLLSHVKS